jgi:hypothetical protein
MNDACIIRKLMYFSFFIEQELMDLATDMNATTDKESTFIIAVLQNSSLNILSMLLYRLAGNSCFGVDWYM